MAPVYSMAKLELEKVFITDQWTPKQSNLRYEHYATHALINDKPIMNSLSAISEVFSPHLERNSHC